jgi:hypothetical protein
VACQPSNSRARTKRRPAFLSQFLVLVFVATSERFYA